MNEMNIDKSRLRKTESVYNMPMVRGRLVGSTKTLRYSVLFGIRFVAGRVWDRIRLAMGTASGRLASGLSNPVSF